MNIDHVATVRNARGGAYPDPLRAAKLSEEAGGLLFSEKEIEEFNLIAKECGSEPWQLSALEKSGN